MEKEIKQIADENAKINLRHQIVYIAQDANSRLGQVVSIDQLLADAEKIYQWIIKQ